jgi:hypothetical protein
MKSTDSIALRSVIDNSNSTGRVACDAMRHRARGGGRPPLPPPPRPAGRAAAPAATQACGLLMTTSNVLIAIITTIAVISTTTRCAAGDPIGNTNKLSLHALDDPDALCLSGTRAGVYAWTGGDPSRWVIQLGSSSAGLDMCLDPARCELVVRDALAKSNATGQVPMLSGAPNVSLMMGIQSQNCSENPTFCRFNQAQLMMCDFALLTGNIDRIGPANRTKLHFRGLQILEASLQKLGQLGLKKARSVLLTGVVHGGTAVFLHADRIGQMLRTIAPNLQTYKALPADGIHPKHYNVGFWCAPPMCLFEWNFLCNVCSCHRKA